MNYKQLKKVLDETGLSPEQLAGRLRISNLTYRRWLKRPPTEEVPKDYARNIAGGLYQLLTEGHLSHDSKLLGKILEHNLPEFFAAAIGQFHTASDLFDQGSAHQDKITSVLLQIGNNSAARRRVEANASKIQAFTAWGNAWKGRVLLLSKAIKSKRLGTVDKLVAYGALFYLILPFDLIPDTIPVFGYIDDFGILGFAVAYYSKHFPELFGDKKILEATA